MQAGTGGRAPFTLGGNALLPTGGTATQGGKALAVGGMMSITMGGRATVVDGPGDPSTVRFRAAAPAPFARSPGMLCRSPVILGVKVTPPKMRLKMSLPRSSRAVAPELHNTTTTTHNAAAAAAD